MSVVILVALVVGGWGFSRYRGQSAFAGPLALPTAVNPIVGPAPKPKDAPPPGLEEQGQPLGNPPQVQWDGSPYNFLRMQTRADGETVPVAWSPCRPIHYVVNPAGAPESFVTSVAAAIGEVSAATGLAFVSDGVTDEQPAPERPAYQPDRYGDRWAPVLIGFADAAHVPTLEGTIAGVASPEGISRSDLDYSVYVSADLWLDTTLLGEPASGGEPAYRPILLHELGHAVGLDHVDDPTQLMNPEIHPGVTTFQSGDLFGLSKLGQGVCAPDL